MAKRLAAKSNSSIDTPRIVLLAGPNGAGKTTASRRLLRGPFRVTEFLNADLIARGISPYEPENAALAASEILLRRMDDLAERQVSFGLESTLARSLAPRIRAMISVGYRCNLLFVWVPEADFAVARVANRVRLGGHNVPEETVRRRYEAGLKNFFSLYQPIASRWRIYDNSDAGRMRIIATGSGEEVRREPPKEDLAIDRTRISHMTKKLSQSAPSRFEDPTDREIDEAMNEAALDALYLHLEADLPMVVWRNGAIAYVHPSTIEIPKNRQRLATARAVKPLGYD